MVLLTTYLANLTKIRKLNGELKPTVEALENIGLMRPIVYYVMRNRGNNAVAPTERMLNHWKASEDWEGYSREYAKRLHTKEAKEWMKNIADESLFNDVILVCFEKDSHHCHRRLLAKEIETREPGVSYLGELHHYSLFWEQNGCPKKWTTIFSG